MVAVLNTDNLRGPPGAYGAIVGPRIAGGSCNGSLQPKRVT